MPKNPSWKVQLYASLIASAAGTGAWLLGVGHWIWPAHAQLAVFFLTIVCALVLLYAWPDGSAAKRPSQ